MRNSRASRGLHSDSSTWLCATESCTSRARCSMSGIAGRSAWPRKTSPELRPSKIILSGSTPCPGWSCRHRNHAARASLLTEDLGEPTMRRASILLAAWVAALLPAALLPAARGPAAAETYPVRPITLVVPFAPGGSASTVARSVADKMSETLGQQIVIDNRGGAGGTLATRAVAKGAPDGYTILVVTSATVGTSPSLLHNLGYDPRKDLDPIGLIAATPNVIVVHPSFPARSLAELIKIGKETATPIPYGSPGTGTLNHLTVELLAYRTGMKLSHVPYKGAAPALNDLLGGHIGVLFSAIPNAHSHIVAGTIRGLAVTGAKRSPLIPAVPTFAEAGLAGYDVP